MSTKSKLVVGVVGLVSALSFAVAASAAGYTFTTNLKMGSSGTDVMNLQKVLNMDPATMVASTGAGSAGNESTYFGAKTKSAVIKFQEKYASDVLAPAGLTKGTGFVGALTRAKLQTVSMGGVTTGTGSTGTTLPSGGSVSVSSATQPMNALAVQSAARVPFTKIMITAGSADVTIKGVTVERQGPAQDAVFAGVVLLDENGLQIGIAKTLNSNHQVVIGEARTIRAGQSVVWTVAGNMAASLTNYAGQVVGLQVNALDANGGTVSGTLPIVGAYHTINASLSIGSAQTAVSSFDPNSSQTKEIGTTNYKFAGIRVTAGSAEQVRLKSIRWNQSGSAGPNDLANVTVYLDGTAYSTVVSADGKYYTANFGSGIVIDKGLSKDIYVQGDIIGSGAAGRTVKFDIYKNTDIYVSGETYGYGITASPSSTGAASDSTSEFTTSTPWFDGSKVTVSAGSVTSIQKSTSASAAAGNIAVNVPNQVLGGFDVDIKGEAISVQSLVFTVASTSPAATVGTVLSNVSIYGPNGNVVAGPVDGVVSSAASSQQTLTFTDTITFPIGKGTYILKGKVPTGVANGSTYVVTTNPYTNWSNITGQTTGNTITMPNASVSMNTMTVKAAALAISISTTPAAANIIAGIQNRLFANVQLDASQSGEDVRFSTIPLKLTFSNAGTANKLTSCQLWDGSTSLTTGSNVVNPSSSLSTGADVTFTLDSSLTIAKNTVKTLGLTCNVSSSAATNSSYSWGIQASPSITVTGVTSSADVSETVSASVGQTMTIAGAGSVVASLHSSSPSYAVVAANTTGNIVGAINLRASNESVNLTKLGLTLTSGSAGDLVQVGVYDGSTLVGTATFTGANTVATSTFANSVNIPKDADKVLTLKADFAQIGSNQVGTPGRLIKVDFLNGEGTGVDSGTTIYPSGSTAVAGARLQKTYPVFTYSTTGATAQNGTNDLLVLNVAANSTGDVMLNKLTFTIASTTLTANNFTFTGPSGNVSSSTILNVNAATTTATVYFDSSSNTSDRVITAGSSKTYTLRVNGVSLNGTNSTGAISAALKADTAYPTLVGSYLMASTTVSGLSGQSILWSPESTTSQVTSVNDDWTNGYGLGGCFTTAGLGNDCTSRTLSK